VKYNFLLIIPTLSSGGAERVMSELANLLVESGHRITIVLWIGGNQFYQLNENVKVIDFDVSHGSKLKKLLSLIHVVYKLRKVYLQEKPDAIVSFLTRSNILSILSNTFLGHKIYISERNSPDSWDDHSFAIRLLRDMLYPKVSGFIAQTTLAKKAAKKRFGIGRIEVIPNPIKKFSISKNMRKEKIILNIGRLEEQKGQKYLIESFARLKRDDWKLVILGEGSLRKELEGVIKEFKMGDNIYLPGNIKNVDEWLEKASIFVLSSIYEGFPNALLEALGVGLPCISFDCPTGPNELITHNENGFLVQLKDIDELTKRMEQLMADENLRKQFSKEAMKVNEKYSIEKISEKLLNFIGNEDNK